MTANRRLLPLAMATLLALAVLATPGPCGCPPVVTLPPQPGTGVGRAYGDAGHVGAVAGLLGDPQGETEATPGAVRQATNIEANEGGVQ